MEGPLVGGGHAPPPVTYAQVVATPVGGGHAPHQPHSVVSRPTTGPVSPQQDTQDQSPRNNSPVRNRRESVQPAPADQIKQEPASKERDLPVRRSSRVNKGKTPKSLEDYVVEL